MKTSASAKCHFVGCAERARWSFDTQREAVEHYPERQRWLCTRHANPERVLSESNPTRITVKTVIEKSYGKFWQRDDGHLDSGFSYGDGYMAYAEDFPSGTTITVTAQLQCPISSPQQPSSSPADPSNTIPSTTAIAAARVRGATK